MMYDILLPDCTHHKALENAETGEGLYAHYVLPDGQCHCIVSKKQMEILDKLRIKSHKHPVDAKASFCKTVKEANDTPIHTFGHKVRDKKVMDAKEPEAKEAKELKAKAVG